MAADTGMQNIAEVEHYARELQTAAIDFRQRFERLKNLTEQISYNWHDKQFQIYHEQFDQNIMRGAEAICGFLENLSKMAQKQCEIHYQAQQMRF